MKCLSTLLFCCLVAPLSGFAQPILINEIMYHPAPAVPEDPGQEWLELFNPSTNAVSLKGWQLNAGVNFVFPKSALIPAGGYLVVASSLTNFQAHYPGVTAVLGDWVGQLSNGGELVRLVDSEGETIDQVIYADAGDWGVRERVPDPVAGLPGWDWGATADGAGRSMEVLNAALPNSSGQNWAPSTTAGGTPGMVNSVSRTNIAPMILETAHFPPVPKPGQTVTVSARLVDEQPTSVIATVYFRNATGSSPPAFNSVPMLDDGAHNDGLAHDGIYAAILPAQTNGSVVEFYVQASDGTNSRTWPAPALDGQPMQTANALYQVDDSEYKGNQQILRLVLTGGERQTLATINPNSDAQMNATLISTDDQGSQIRYLCSIRIRGAGSRSRPTKNYRVNIPSDQPWKGLTAINLNSQYSHIQVVGSVLSQKSGLPVADATFVQVRVNGVNLARSGTPTTGDGAGWGTYALLEPINNEWAGNRFPNDPNGNVYRASSGAHLADLSYRGTDPASYTSRGYSKTSNGAENDWTDLSSLTDVLNNTPDATYRDAVSQRLNVPEWMTYFAVFSLMEYTETSLGSGEGDDYALYRGLVEPRFLLIGHDFDTIFSQGDTAGNLNESIWVAADVADQPAVDRFMKFPEFAPLYYQELYRLATTVFSPDELDPVFDQFLTGVATEPTITSMKTFATTRTERVLNQIPRAIRITNSLSVVNGYPTATTPEVALTGAANAIRSRSVRVNGLPATWTPWRGAWSIAGVPLLPGVNRLLVQSFDAAGAEVERNTTDIFYDDGSVTTAPASIAANTTWTAAAGPYQVDNSLTIEAGATLTIEPGTTVLFGAGVDVTVANGGRLLAEGTETASIRFTRIPGANNWGGLTVNGGPDSPETRIGYAHFEFNGDTAIHATDGTLFLHHLTFGNTARQYVSLDRSSFVVRDCLFPTSTAGFEPVHGTGGIKAGGHGLLLHNFWGKTMGYNDSVDFTGGNRPGPILHVINNVFTGSDDDILDLDSTDAWVEGNIFLHVHRNGSPDSASAISGGADNADRSQITAIGNLFYDVDQVANAKQGNFYTLINNTIVRQTHVGGQDPEAGVVILADEGTVEGAGMYLEGNIVYQAEKLVRNQTSSLVTFTNNLLNLDWAGPGGGNVKADPLLNYVPRLAETTNFATFEAAQIFREWFALQPGSPARGAGPYGLDQGGLIPVGAFVQVEPSVAVDGAPVTVRVGLLRKGDGITDFGFPEGSGYTAFRWRLDGGAWSAETPQGTDVTLTGLSPGLHRVEVSGKRDSGLYQDDPLLGMEAALSSQSFVVIATPPARVVLNEVLAANNSAFAVNGTFPDAIELHNAGGTEAAIGGWSLTDDASSPRKFVVPAATVLAPGAFLVVLADNGPVSDGRLHAGFALEQRGETVSLFSASGDLIDQVRFGIQLSDLSIGRDASGNWTLCRPTLGAANTTHAVANPSALQINEWLANSRSLYPDDFVELYNSSTAPVLLGGLHLTDEVLGWPGRHQVTPLTFMAGRSHFVFIADGDEEKGADHLNFKLAAENGSIGLLDAATNLLDCVSYATQLPDVSEGRRPSGASLISSFNTPSPGAANPAVLGSVTVTSFSTSLLSTSAVWRYEQSNVDLGGTGWQATNYVDAGWAQGPGVFGWDNDFAVQPYQTLLSIANSKFTFYFRTTFIMPTNPAGHRLEGVMWLDDGAVIYLNGAEATRVRMPNGALTFTTRANNVGDATRETIVIPSGGLVRGTNTLAVEVHQSTATSGDVVWGLELNAVRSVTNAFVFGVTLNEVMARNLSFAQAGGTNLADWVELYNPSTNRFDLSGLSLSDDLEQPRRWVFPDGATLLPGGYLVVRCDPNAPVSTQMEPVLNTGFGLESEAGDAVYLFDAEERGGSLLDSVAFGLQVADYAIGRVPNGQGSWVLTLPTPGQPNIASALGSPGNLIINEWLANPSGNNSDFIELYNPLPQPVDLSPLFLSDTLTNRTRSAMRPLSFIGVGEAAFVRLVADGDPKAGADHVDFGLSGSGELIAVFGPNQELLTSVTFGPQENGVSEGRFPDGSTNIVRFRGTSTPGRSNLLPLDAIAISEVLTHTDAPFEDAIELVNVSQSAVDLSGFYLSDQRTDPKRFRIPAGTILPAGGRHVYYETEFNNPNLNGRPPSFALSSSQGDQVFLFSADAAGNLTGFRTGAEFGAAPTGVSFGRYLTSVGADFTLLTQRTFGADNPSTVEEFRTGQGLPNAGPRIGPVVLSEIHYHPPDLIVGGVTNDNVDEEFIELLNISGAEVPLFDPAHRTNTWRLRDAVDYEFAQDVSLPAGARLVVVGFDPTTNAAALASFRTKYLVDAAVPIHGPWRGRLANDGENVELYQPDAPQEEGLPDAGEVPYLQVDKVKYADSAPWPSLADATASGVGLSLHRRQENAYGNDPVNWVAAAPTPGSGPAVPPIAPPSVVSITADHDVAPGSSDTLSVTANGGAPLSYQWRLDGVVIPGATGATLALGNLQVTDAGLYTVLVMNPAGAAAGTTRVSLRSPPFIVRQPANTISVAGGSALFSVVAGGAEPLTYQWLKNSATITGAQNPVLTLSNLQATDVASYRALITNPYGSITSTVATLNLNSPPLIVTQPHSTNVFVGSSATLTVGVVGSSPFRYQWRYNGANIGGATNATLTLVNIQLTTAGEYSVAVSNAVGSALSAAAVVIVYVPPVVSITASDALAGESAGNPGQFTVERTGPTDTALAVNFLMSGSATPGSDYGVLVGPLLIPAGTNAASIAVQVVDDSVREGNETVIMTLAAASTYVVGSPANATVVLSDNDNLPPQAAVLSPPDGFRTTFPASILFTASALDPDGTVTRVEYFADGTNRLGQSTVSPYAFLWTNAAPGTYAVTAVATDNLGSTGVSFPARITVNAAPIVSILAPANGANLPVGADITILASAADVDGSIASVEFYEGANLLTNDTVGPFVYVWPSVPAGEYMLTARATDNRGAVTISAPVVIIVGATPARFGDNFGNRGILTGFTNTLTGSSSNFTREAGEPRHDGRNGAHSGWITWTAPASGLCIFDTFGSSFDTVLAVYTNSVLTNLVKVVSNDDANLDTSDSQIRFNVVAGTVYQIAIDGFSATAAGLYTFHSALPNPYPVITQHPQGLVVTQGMNVTFTVAAVGPPAGGPLSYQWRLNNSAIAGATSPTLARLNVGAPDQGNYVAVVSNSAGSVTSAPAFLSVATAPFITTQPADITVPPGNTATFFVRATGVQPFSYQWFFNGTLIPEATASNLVVTEVLGRYEGNYSVVISNALGTTPSRQARLSVNDGLYTARLEPILSITNEWRYHNLGVDLGTEWREPGYDDSSWSNGIALFGLEDPGIYPEPIRTPLPLNSSNGFVRTFYFRTVFPLTDPLAFSGVFVNSYVDDGAVWYINGREAGRVRIPANLPVDGVHYNDFATGVTAEGASSPVVLLLTNAMAGANTLAVEVHQNTGTSSDIVFGMSLDSITPVTNGPVLLPLEFLQGDMVRITLSGIPGRDYAIDTSPDLQSWTTIATFTDFNEPIGTMEVPRQPLGQHFYRARVVPWTP